MGLSLNIGGMLGGSGFVPNQIPLRAQIAWARILDMPTDIELRRGDTTLDIQTVRIEFFDSFTQQNTDDSGVGNTKRVMLYGTKGHPEIDDLDIREWDTFVLDDKNYTVVFVNRQLHSEIQAEAEVV